MALHGPIKINHYEAGQWWAERVVTGDDGVNLYKCGVEWTPEGEHQVMGSPRTGQYTRHARFWSGEIRHHYKDGALALAAKILVTATKESSDGIA